MTGIFLDGRTIQDHFPGIGRYAFQLAHALGATFPEQRLRVAIDAGARNTRFERRALSTMPNLELVSVHTRLMSPGEQLLGRQNELVRDMSVWHSPFYTFPLTVQLPLVVTLADLTPLILPVEMPSAARRFIYRMLNRLAARRANAVITFSNASRADLVRMLQLAHAKISVIPLAADPAFQPASTAHIQSVRERLGLAESYALYVGSNKPHKNLPRLVQAWAEVKTETVLVLAGVWDARYPQTKELVARLDLERRVLFRHDISERDLPALMSGARVFVFPSVHEGFGLPPLEAMACGTPVACANASSLPEVVGDAALLFNPFEPSDIARVLGQILDDTHLRASLQEAGMRRARDFSWERTAVDTMAVYRGVETER